MSRKATAKTSMLSSNLGRRPNPTISAWMGSKASPDMDESRPDRHPVKDTTVSALEPAETEINGPAHVTRNDSMSSLESLDHDMIGDGNSCAVVEPAEVIAGDKGMPRQTTNCPKETEATSAQSKTKLPLNKRHQNSSMKGRLLDSFRWKSKNGASDMSKEEAERLEKELHVNDIKKEFGTCFDWRGRLGHLAT